MSTSWLKNYDNVISKIHQIVELNVGHFIISNSIYIGLEETVKKIYANYRTS